MINTVWVDPHSDLLQNALVKPKKHYVIDAVSLNAILELYAFRVSCGVTIRYTGCIRKK